ncbi:MAG: hypothetical protein ACX94B_12955 [Henriciella sp.]
MTHVTVPDEDSFRVVDVVASTTGPFQIEFTVFDKADLRVSVDDVELTQSDFSFVGTAGTEGGFDGGEVTLVTAVENANVKIWRDIRRVRADDVETGNPNQIRDINTALDRHTAQAQDDRRDLLRSLLLDVGESGFPLGLKRALFEDGLPYISNDAWTNLVVSGLKALTDDLANGGNGYVATLAALETELAALGAISPQVNSLGLVASSIPTLVTLLQSGISLGSVPQVFSTKAALKANANTSVGFAFLNDTTNGEVSTWGWDASVTVDTHQADTGELKYLAPNAATAGAWVSSSPVVEDIAAFDQIKVRLQLGRVDFVGIGDSNQVHQGNGWDHGFQAALSDLAPMYATGLISINEGNDSGSGLGYRYNFNASGPVIGAITGAPSDLNDYWDVGSGTLGIHYYGYLASGETVTWGNNSGLILGAATADVLDVTADLIFDWHYGTFNTGTGKFRGAVRQESSPFTTYVSSAADVVSNTGSFGMQRETLQLSADAARAGLNIGMRWTAVGHDITGPFFGLWMRAHNPNRLNGFSYSTLVYQGGQSLRTMANSLQELSDTTLGYYFGELRRLQGDVKTIVICVNSGLNDRNESLTSVGPGAVTDGDSAAAYVDNFKAIQARIEAIWTLNNWDLRELFWLVFPSHPVSDPDNAELLEYRAAIEAHVLNMDQAQFINIAELTNETEMLANNWYQNSGSDRNHLTEDGFEQVSRKIFDAIK